MTAETRLDRDLPAILEALYLGPSPDYRDEVMAAAVGTRQRPSWTFAGRWFPVADIATRPVFAPRAPWRAIWTVILIVVLLLVVAVFVGSRQTKTAPPFGIARNGLIAYSVYGNIYTADAATGETKAIVTGPALDSGPVFSRDGTKVAFLRTSNADGDYDLMVASSDGSGVKALPGSPIQGMDVEHDFDFEWAADSRSLIVYAEPRILRLDAVGSAAPTVLTTDAVPTGRLGPSGLIPYQPSSIAEDALWTLGIDGAAPRELIRKNAATSSGGDLSYARFSPDGSMLAFQQNLLPDEPYIRIFVANADGTGARRLTNEAGPGYETDFAWSPDSKQIAFNRWVSVDPAQPSGDWEPQPIGIASVDRGGAGSSVFTAGPSQGSLGADFEWSPDGSALIAMPARPGQAVRLNPPTLIDVATGEARTLDLTTNAFASWQRLAP